MLSEEKIQKDPKLTAHKDLKGKERFVPWSNWTDSGIKRSWLYSHPDLYSYARQYSQQNDFHVVNHDVQEFLALSGVEPEISIASIYEPQQLFDTLAQFGNDMDPMKKAVYRSVGKEALSCAFDRAMRTFGYDGLGKLQVNLSEESIKSEVKLAKSGGIWFSNKEDSWDDAWNHSQRAIRKEVRLKPYIAYYRTQRNNKSRLVWCSGTDSIILEGMFIPQLIKAFKKHDVMAIGQNPSELGMSVSEIVNQRRHIYGLDYSKFDSTVPSDFIVQAFRILRTWFPEFDEKTEIAWKLMIDNFLHGNIVMPDGYLYKGRKKGIPSGSWATQVIGSIVNYMVTVYITHRAGQPVYGRNVLTLGDDSVFGLDISPSLTKLTEFAAELGMKVNPEKSHTCLQYGVIHFLGFDWKDAKRYRDLMELLQSAIYSERLRKRETSQTIEQQIRSRVLLAVALSNDGVEQAVALGLGSRFNFDPKTLADTPMMYQIGVSNYLDFKVEYDMDENNALKSGSFTFQQAMKS